MERWLALSAGAGAVAGVIGLWFWQREASYARLRGGELASVLQWVGVGLFVLAVAVVALGAALWSASRRWEGS